MEKRETLCAVGGTAIWCRCCGKCCESAFKKLKEELPCDPAILHLDIYKKKNKIETQEDIYTFMIIVALFIMAKIWNQTKSPLMNEWTKRCKDYLPEKKMSEMSETKKIDSVLFFLYVESKNKSGLMDIEDRLVVT